MNATQIDQLRRQGKHATPKRIYVRARRMNEEVRGHIVCWCGRCHCRQCATGRLEKAMAQQ
jgi:hypothetical protein